MSILDLVIAPEDILFQKTKPVENVDEDIKTLVSDMFESLYHYHGAGLAAPQVGSDQRLFVIHLPKDMDPNEPKLACINPEIIYASEEEKEMAEGCLSIPIPERTKVKRPADIILKYLDEEGRQQKVEASGWLSVAIQHELDHLNGITLLDHMSKMKRDRAIKKLLKYKKIRKL